MTTSTIHRSEMIEQLQSSAVDKKQMLRHEMQDSVVESQEAQNSIVRMRRGMRIDDSRIYNQNIEMQRQRKRQLSQGSASLFESRAKIRSLRTKESRQSQEVFKYSKLKKQYSIAKSQELEQKKIDAQNRQGEIYQKAQELLNNMLATRKIAFRG